MGFPGFASLEAVGAYQSFTGWAHPIGSLSNQEDAFLVYKDDDIRRKIPKGHMKENWKWLPDNSSFYKENIHGTCVLALEV